MDKNEFKTFCAKEFKVRGFKKYRSMFYLAGKELMCGINLQKSNYGNIYYVDYSYFIGVFNDLSDHPTYYDSDVNGRIVVMSKSDTIQGKHFLTAQIKYEEYTEEELKVYFDKYFEEVILPPIYQGKKHILDNMGKFYNLAFKADEVMQKLLNK